MNETRKTNNAAQRRRTKLGHTKTTKSRKKNKIDAKITFFNKREREKRVGGVILSQILTLNHPSLVDEGEKTRVLVTTIRERKGRETPNTSSREYPSFH